MDWLFPAAENDRSLLLYNYTVAFAGCNSILQGLRRKKNHFHGCKSHFAKRVCENSWPAASLLLESSLEHHTDITNLAKSLKAACTLHGVRREKEEALENRARNG